MKNDWFGPVIFVAVLAFAGIAIYVAIQNEKKRRELLQSLAEGLGFEFDPKPTDFAIQKAGMDLFGKGRGKAVKNLMTGRGKDEGLYVFDYYYKTGGGKHTRHWRQTVVGFDLGNRRVPRFSVQPRSIGKVFGAFFSGKEVKLDQHPEFSKDHFVSGEHDAAVRDLLREPIVREFGPEKVLCLEGNDRWLIVYRQAKLAKPEEFDELIGRARGFRAHFLNS